MLLNDKIYNILKKIVQIFLPAAASAYSGLAAVWNWPAVVEVVTTITVVTTFLGVVLGISSTQFKKQVSDNAPDGDLIVSETDGEKYFGLGINQSAYDNIGDKTTVHLNVVRNKPSE